jgi:hypothetical protein
MIVSKVKVILRHQTLQIGLPFFMSCLSCMEIFPNLLVQIITNMRQCIDSKINVLTQMSKSHLKVNFSSCIITRRGDIYLSQEQSLVVFDVLNLQRHLI